MTSTPDFSHVPTSPPVAPEGWMPGQAVAPPPPAPSRRWGMVDIVLGFLFIIASVVMATVVSLVIVGFDAAQALADGDLSGTDALVFLGATTLVQGLAMGLWPVIVARWKGNGVRSDFGWTFQPVDVGYGLGLGALLLVLGSMVAAGVSFLVGVEPGAAEATNTQIVEDASDSAALWIIVVAAVVIAPIVEELFFRGLCLRAIEGSFGTTAAIIGSTALFTLPHFANPSLAGTAVLFSAIAVVGVVLAVVTVRTGRLGAAVIAHAAFNGVGVVATLLAT